MSETPKRKRGRPARPGSIPKGKRGYLCVTTETHARFSAYCAKGRHIMQQEANLAINEYLDAKETKA